MLVKLSDKEIKSALDQMVILIDSREQKNVHITAYLDKKQVSYKTVKLEQGDYTCMLPSGSIQGIMTDTYFNIAIERKANLNELAGNFTERTRLENEFMRAKFAGTQLTLLIENEKGYENIILGNYRSEYRPQSFLGTLKTFEHRYGINAVFIGEKASGNYIYHHLLYYVREELKRGWNK